MTWPKMVADMGADGEKLHNTVYVLNLLRTPGEYLHTRTRTTRDFDTRDNGDAIRAQCVRRTWCRAGDDVRCSRAAIFVPWADSRCRNGRIGQGAVMGSNSICAREDECLKLGVLGAFYIPSPAGRACRVTRMYAA